MHPTLWDCHIIGGFDDEFVARALVTHDCFVHEPMVLDDTTGNMHYAILGATDTTV
jgi:hypothetical protein